MLLLNIASPQSELQYVNYFYTTQIFQENFTQRKAQKYRQMFCPNHHISAKIITNATQKRLKIWS